MLQICDLVPIFLYVTFVDGGGQRGSPGGGGGESVPYWSDAILPDSPASVPPNPSPQAHGHGHGHSQWPGQANPYAMNSGAPGPGPGPAPPPVEPTNLVENADGSASATLTVPNNVTSASEQICASIVEF